MDIYLIRHGKTAGNLLGKYIGITDEPLCAQGEKELAKIVLPQEIDGLYVSPLLRCRQTASLLFPQQEQIVINNFRECSFGAFENKNYQELSGNADYQAWIDSGGILPFPGGENRAAFQKRCVEAFCSVLLEAAKAGKQTIACVVHGGTIMSVMEALEAAHQDYFSYQAGNGCGYLLHWQPPKDICKKNLAQPERTVDFTLSICYSI